MKLDFTGERLILGKSPQRLEQEHLERYEFAKQYVRGKVVLDIACGTGYGSKMMSDAGASLVEGVDIDDRTISYAQENYSNSRIIYSTGDIVSYNKLEQFDTIVCFETIEHVKDYRVALRNLYNALVPGGKLIISSPNRSITSPDAKSLNDKLSNDFHTQEFSLSEMVSELQAVNFLTGRSSAFGQRSQLRISNSRLRSLYHRFFMPNIRSSAVVKKLGNLPPRIIIVVATKPSP